MYYALAAGLRAVLERCWPGSMLGSEDFVRCRSGLGLDFWRNVCTSSGKVINGGSRDRALGALDFQNGTPISKSNRISLAYGLTINKDPTFIDKCCSVFFSYRGICRFCAIFGRFGRPDRF